MTREAAKESVLKFIEVLGLQDLRRFASHLPPPNSDVLKGVQMVNQ
jgi:hypothetical protein